MFEDGVRSQMVFTVDVGKQKSNEEKIGIEA